MNNNEMTNTRASGTSINKNKLEILLSECRFSYEFYKKKIIPVIENVTNIIFRNHFCVWILLHTRVKYSSL